MSMLNTFDPATTKKTLERLDKLSNTTKPQWGKMNSAQMLAHLSVAYDLAYGNTQSKVNPFAKLMLKLFVKNIVVSETPYKRNSRTAPDFVIADERNFETEKERLMAHIKDTEAKGTVFFEGRKSSSFGIMTSKEWSNQFYKHLDHHFTQFGV